LDENDPVGDWFSRTGKSHFQARWQMDQDTQKFFLWTPDGEKDLGDEVLEGRSQNEIWQEPPVANSSLALEEFNDYQMYLGQDLVTWEDLPLRNTSLFPKASQFQTAEMNSGWLMRMQSRNPDQPVHSRASLGSFSRLRKSH
jgi:hypothetical protein